MGYRAGEFAGPYEVLQLLGRGTFGEVFVARDSQRPRHHVALKTVACDQLGGDVAERVRESALAEAQLLIRLRHPHIVRCEQVQWHAERGIVWLALEFMDGGDAQGLVNKRREAGEPPFESHFVRRVLAAVGSALRYVHAQGVLHRDVKPANVLLARRSQRIKLGDFGISKLLEATGRAHTVVGTPYYLAPEIVSGQAYGPAADAWALGVCLYELACLRRPFEAGNPLALVRRICEEEPLQLPQGTAADLNRAILSLLKRDPQRRLLISDALEVSDAVAALAAPSPGSPAEGSTASPRDISEQQSTHDFIPPPPVASNELSPVSAVSLMTSESGCSNSPCEADIVASLCAPHQQTPLERTLEPEPAAPARPSSWQGIDVVLQAQAALSSDQDDPEELQLALRALEGQSPLEGNEAVKALQTELRLRLAALRQDATNTLESLLEPPLGRFPGAAVAAPLRGPAPGWRLLAPPMGPAPVAMAAGEEAAEVTTFIAASGNDTSGGDGVAALATAIELATSLGLDTSFAEERAASGRGLLSIRITWGNVSRICLLRVGVPFQSLVQEVARRFGLADCEAAVAGSPPFKLTWRSNADILQVRDQASWEMCLHRCGVYGRPGRVELRLEVPFVITGTRVPSVASAVFGAAGPVVGGARVATPTAAVAGRCRKVSEKQVGRGSFQRASLQRAGGEHVPIDKPPTHRTHARRRTAASAVPATGCVAAALRLEGHRAAARVRGRVPTIAAAVPRAPMPAP